MKLKFLSKPVFKEFIFILSVFPFLLPGPYLPAPTLDSSWQVVLEAAFFEGWKFGDTVNFTGGPLSFLYTPTSTGYHVFGQIFAESLVLVLALILIFRSARVQNTWIQILIAMSLAISSAVGKDSLYIASIAAGSMIIIKTEKPKYSLYLIPTFFALLGLMKFSFAVLGFICLLILIIGSALKDSRLDSAKLAGSGILALLGIWLLAGQKLSSIADFIVNSYHISRGYLWNMHLQESPHIFYFLLFFLIITSLPIFLACIAKRKDLRSWLILSVATATIYLSWKAGVTRGGSHLSIFVQSSFLVSILVLPLISRPIISKSWITILSISFFATFVWIYPGGFTHIGSLGLAVFKHNMRVITNPLRINENYTNLLPVVKSKYTLPKIKDHVGESIVDALQFHQGITFLNDLNYHPRPTVQSYHGFNSHLLNLNLRHIQSDPPDFLISKFEIIDNRFPFSDDCLFNLEVFQNYRPVLIEKDYLLLERLNQPNRLTFTDTVLEKTVGNGQDVELSEFSNHMLWLQIDYTPTFPHRFAAFLYKPEILKIRLTMDDGSTRSYRLPAGILGDGFLLNPLLESNEDLEQFLNSHKPMLKITRFKIVSESPHAPFKTEKFKINLSLLVSSDISNN